MFQEKRLLGFEFSNPFSDPEPPRPSRPAKGVEVEKQVSKGTYRTNRYKVQKDSLEQRGMSPDENYMEIVYVPPAQVDEVSEAKEALEPPDLGRLQDALIEKGLKVMKDGEKLEYKSKYVDVDISIKEGEYLIKAGRYDGFGGTAWRMNIVGPYLYSLGEDDSVYDFLSSIDERIENGFEDGKDRESHTLLWGDANLWAYSMWKNSKEVVIGQSAHNPDPETWGEDFEKFFKPDGEIDVSKLDKDTVVLFTAPGFCQPCRKIGPLIAESSIIHDGEIDFVTLEQSNYGNDFSDKVERKYGVEMFPSVIIYDADTGQIKGPMTIGEVVKMVDSDSAVIDLKTSRQQLEDFIQGNLS